MANSILELILRSRKEGPGVSGAKSDLQQLDQQAKTTSGGMNLLTGAAMGAGMAAFNMGVDALKSVPAMLDQADAIGDAEQALIAYAGSQAVAEQTTDKMVDATNGILTEFEAAQLAVKLFGTGLADSADEAAEMTSQAVILGDAVGIDATQAVEKYTTLMQTKSVRAMKEFGLNIQNVKDRTAELQEEQEGLTEDQAAAIAIQEELDRKQQQLADSGYEVGTSYERLKTNFKQGMEELAVGTSDVIIPAIDALEDHQAAVENDILAAARATDTYIEWLGEIGLLTTLLEGVGKKEYEAAEAALVLEHATELSTGRTRESRDALREMRDATGEAEEKAKDLADTLEDELKAKLDDLQLLISGPVGDAYDEFKEKNDELKLKALDLKLQIDELEEQEYLTPEQRTQLGELKTEYGNTQMAFTQLADQHGEDTKRILFNLLTQKASIDGLSEAEYQLLEDTAYTWGLIDEETWRATGSMGDALAALAEGDLGLAKSILDDMLETVESFPEEIDLTFNIHTNGTIPGGVSGIPIGAQGGFHGMVTQPTLFLAGEGGQPEYVNVTPMSQVTPAQSMSAGPGLVIENLHLSLPNVTNGRDFYDELVRELNRRRKLAAVAGIHVAGKF